jgi:hypothetical protein
VPEDFSDLKAALSAAQSGDRVLVRGERWRSGRPTRTGVVLFGKGAVLSGDEVRSTGHCGITAQETSDLTLVVDCSVSGAAWSAAFNLGDRPTFSGGSYVGGIKVDVLDLGEATRFANAAFATKSDDPALQPYR